MKYDAKTDLLELCCIYKTGEYEEDYLMTSALIGKYISSFMPGHNDKYGEITIVMGGTRALYANVPYPEFRTFMVEEVLPNVSKMMGVGR